MTTQRFFTVFGVVAVSAFLLAACRADEQGRITRYEPGVYLGKKDTQLSEAQKQQLNQRHARQSSATFRSSGGGGSPSQSAVDTKSLGTRVEGQRQR